MNKADSNNYPKIITAVKFLEDVSTKGYSEEMLRKYLVKKRKLSLGEVNAAFMINRGKMKSVQRREEVNGVKPRTLSKPKKRSKIHDVRFLVKSRRLEGRLLILVFLDNERKYCSALMCLKQ